MELIRGYYNLRSRHHGCVLTIGNFDGVHLGHQSVIAQLTQAAAQTGLPAVLMIFEPQPQEFFSPNTAPARLTRLREKLQWLHTTPVDRVLCLRFDRSLAKLSPERFIADLLVDRLGIKCIVIGDDFRFGHRGAGNFALLRDAGERFGFATVKQDTYLLDGERISSSRIRAVLAAGDFSTATRLLGRPYCICGRVSHGDRLGRTIGFPTANVALHRLKSPLSGVYTVRVSGLGNEPIAGMANLGIRPTVGGVSNRLEVHLFDFNDDIYGCHIEVEFLHRIRNERRFDSLAALTRQIQADAEQARAFFDCA